MQQDGLIQISRYRKYPSSIVVIGQYGAKLVCKYLVEEYDNVKCAFPRVEELGHDLMVSSSIRKIIYEDAQLSNKYRIDWYSTEYFLSPLLLSGPEKIR